MGVSPGEGVVLLRVASVFYAAWVMTNSPLIGGAYHHQESAHRGLVVQCFICDNNSPTHPVFNYLSVADQTEGPRIFPLQQP